MDYSSCCFIATPKGVKWLADTETNVKPTERDTMWFFINLIKYNTDEHPVDNLGELIEFAADFAENTAESETVKRHYTDIVMNPGVRVRQALFDGLISFKTS